MPTNTVFDWTLPDALKTLKDTTIAFCEQHIAPIADEIDCDSRFPRELWPKFGKAHLHGITVDQAYGGSNLGYLAHAIVIEIISQYSASIGLSYAAHANLCMNQIVQFGSDTQKQAYLPKLVSGEWLGALAMSEKQAGSDVLNMQLHAEDKGDHYLLNGHKMWITNGPTADLIVVYAKTKPEDGPHGISAFLIEKTFPGFSTNKKLDKLGMRGSDTGELIFKDCVVPKENLLGKANDGLNILMSGLDYERTLLSAGPLGIMQACINLVIPYVQRREQFHQPIGNFEMIQHKLATLYTQLQATRAYVYRAAEACDNHHITSELAASCYLFSAENATQLALDTIQCLGGYGYLNDCAAGRLLRDAKLYEIGAGTTEIRRLVIAKQMMKETA